MEVVNANEIKAVDVATLELGTMFSLNQSKYIRSVDAKTVICGNDMLQNVIGVNVETGTYLFKPSPDEVVFVVPLHTAKVVIE